MCFFYFIYIFAYLTHCEWAPHCTFIFAVFGGTRWLEEAINICKRTTFKIWWFYLTNELLENRTTCTGSIKVRSGRISGRLSDIEIIRPDIQYCRIFSLTLLKLSGWISSNLVFNLKQHWYHPVKPEISGPTLVKSKASLEVGRSVKHVLP